MMNLKSFSGTVALGIFATVSCFGSTIDLGINGDADVGTTFINFGNYPTGTVYTPAPGYGNFVVSQPPTGIFLSAGVSAGEAGMIQSLDATVTPPGTTLTPNPVTALPFLTFDTGGSNLKVFLTELLPGTTGPFSLIDTPGGAVASFGIDGFVYNTTDKSEESLTGVFSATFVGTTVAELLTEEAAGTNVKTPFSGTFSATVVPEPASLLLLAGGLVGFVLLYPSRKIRS